MMDSMRQPGEFNYIVATVAADVRDSGGALFATDRMVASSHSPKRNDVDQLIEAKKNRPARETAFNIIDPSDDGKLRTDRAQAIRLARHILGLLSEVDPNSRSALYAFADIQSIVSAEVDPYELYQSRHTSGPTVLARTEETLAGAANTLIDQLPSNKISGDDQFIASPSKNIALRGYTLNRNSADSSQRLEFPDFPACEVFMATAAAEQADLVSKSGGEVLRIIPSSMRDREIGARALLRSATGQMNWPITSVTLSKEGDIQRTLPWSNEPSQYKEFYQSLKAHRTSNQLSKQLFDETMSASQASFKTLSHPESPYAVSPSKLLEEKLLTGRIHEFLSRNLKQAIVYTHGQGNEGSPADDVMTAKELYDYFDRLDDSPRRAFRVINTEHHSGYGTNDVTVIEAILSERKQHQPSIFSEEISHLRSVSVHEQLPDGIDFAKLSPGAYHKLLTMHPPKYCHILAQHTN